MTERIMVVFDRPEADESREDWLAVVEQAWNRWADKLGEYGFVLDSDLDPIEISDHCNLEVYTAVRVVDA